MSRLESLCDRLHAKARGARALHRFTWFNRILLFLAFFPTGLIKACGWPFAGPDIGEPLYGFFTALWKTGLWWRFIGLSQVVAALLLLIPGLRHLGAVVFLPVLLNVTVVTFSLPFAGTRYVTTGMLLANLYLVCWDYHRWRGLLPWWSGREARTADEATPATIEKWAIALTLASGTIALDRLHYFNDWVSAATVQTSMLIFMGSLGAMCLAFLRYGLPASLKAPKAVTRQHG